MTDRRRLRDTYGDLYDRVCRLLFEVDPMGINFETNEDEYEPEVDTILPRLKTANSQQDVRRIVVEEFAHWFGEDAGDATAYDVIADRLWAMWLESPIRRAALS